MASDGARLKDSYSVREAGLAMHTIGLSGLLWQAYSFAVQK